MRCKLEEEKDFCLRKEIMLWSEATLSEHLGISEEVEPLPGTLCEDIVDTDVGPHSPALSVVKVHKAGRLAEAVPVWLQA